MIFSVSLGMSLIRVLWPYFEPLIKFNYIQILNFINVLIYHFSAPHSDATMKDIKKLKISVNVPELFRIF